MWWEVVHHYPATEAQLAARDYLEMEGHVVDESLIVPPAPPPAPAVDSTAVDSTKIAPALAMPPATVPAIGAGAFGPPDSARVGRFGPGGEPHPSLMDPSAPGYAGPHPPGAQYDSTGRVIDPRLAPQMPDTARVAPPDTTQKRKADDK
jgi:hypothetical protein